MRVDPDLLAGWLTARSIARELPAPVAVPGGWRVDTGTADEDCRYVFREAGAAMRAVGQATDRPGIALRVCAEPIVARAALPECWRLSDPAHVMVGHRIEPEPLPLPYSIETDHAPERIAVRIVGPDGLLAAGGYGAWAGGWFVYDRIVTEAAHRRRGLGRAVMAALAQAAPIDARHVLVATPMGRMLYERLGWGVVAPYASAVIPASA